MLEQRTPKGGWIAEAVRMATDNVSSGGGPFGALVARDDELIATGTNRVTIDHDPSAHAEITAIRAACRELGTFSLRGCVLVVSCEPCPMCLAAALWARLDGVYYAADREDAALAGFDDRAFHELFNDPEATWPTRVEQVDLAGRNEPFEAWRDKPDRVEY